MLKCYVYVMRFNLFQIVAKLLQNFYNHLFPYLIQIYLIFHHLVSTQVNIYTWYAMILSFIFICL